MELLIKISITLVTLFVAIRVLCWTWKSHIDTIASIRRVLFSEPQISEVLVTRDSNKLYQNGKEVGDVTGNVEETKEKIIFKQIANCSDLNTSDVLEYQRFKLKITQIGTVIGMKSQVSPQGSKVLQNVMEDVVCEKCKP